MSVIYITTIIVSTNIPYFLLRCPSFIKN